MFPCCVQGCKSNKCANPHRLPKDNGQPFKFKYIPRTQLNRAAFLPKDKKMTDDFIYYENKIKLRKTILSKGLDVFEIDPDKTDYEHFFKLRNKHY